MANCANEYPGPNDIARVESPVTHQNAKDAYDQLMFIKVVSLLVANQDGNEEDMSVDRLRDLGRLFFFLAEQPSDVLGELASERQPRDHDPDPGKHEPVLVPISEKRAAEG